MRAAGAQPVGSEKLAVLVIAALAACNRRTEAEAPTAPSGQAGNRPAAELICAFAPSQSVVVSHLASAAGGASIAAAAIAKAAGLTAVLHSSGAYIFTGSSGYVAGTLGTAVVGPVVLAVGVAVAGTAGTVELLCAPRNHPEWTAKVEAAAAEFISRSKGSVQTAVSAVGPMTAELGNAVVKSGNDALEYARRKSVAVSDAFRK